MKTKNNIIERLGMWAVGVGIVLLIPLFAKAPWTRGDFVFAGVVLFSLATVYEFTTKNMVSMSQRVMVGVGVVLTIGLILAWAAAGPD